MSSLYLTAMAVLLTSTTALSLRAPSDDCYGLGDGSTYTTGGKPFLITVGAVKSYNNLGDPTFGASFVDCMTRCATTTDCTDLSYTSGGTCYLKQGYISGTLSTESGTCDAMVQPISSTSTTTVSSASICAAITETTTATSTLTVTASATSNAACSKSTDAIVNGGFESFPSPWSLNAVGANAQVQVFGYSTPYGSQALRVYVPSTILNPQSFTQIVSICPGTMYELTYAAERGDLSGGGVFVDAFLQVGPYSTDAQQMLFGMSVALTWTTYSGAQVPIPQDAQYSFALLTIRVSYSNDGNGQGRDMWFDNVKFAPVV